MNEAECADPDAIITQPLLAVGFAGIIVIGYFAFVLLAAVAKPLMGARVWPGVSVGIAAAVLLIILCMVLSAVFVLVANRSEKSS